MRALLVKLVLILLPAAGMMAANYRYDPARLFHPGVTEQMGALLAKGYDVTGLNDYDERLVQRYYVEHIKQPNTTIVLGSSRAMQFRSDEFPGERFFNNGVSGGTVEDFIAIYGLYLKRQMEPRTVVLGIDPWMLNGNNGQTRWQSLADEYRRMRAVMGLPKERMTGSPADSWEWARISPLFSPDYFQVAMRSREQPSPPAPRPTDQAFFQDAAITRHDGWHIYPGYMILKPTAVVHREAQMSVAQKPMYSLDNFDQLSPSIMTVLERFIDFLRGRGVAVKLVMVPYHPVSYEAMLTDPYYKRVLDAENYVRHLGESKHLAVYGSYNPAAMECPEDEFFDGMHARPACLSRVMAKGPR